jgi:tRNA pseudouridine55 synthase
MNAFLLIDKSEGISSFDVIRQLRKASGIRKIGHAGTLDPFATGLLICAMGQYTRLLKYAEARYKTYEATLLLGKRTSTGDPEGEVIEEQDFSFDGLDTASLRDKAMALKELRLPQYSAIKIEGKRAYQYAREGVKLDMPLREVKIFDFEVLGTEGNNLLSYRVRVSKGTYIRSFSEWLAEELGSIGMTTALRRTRIGNLAVENAGKMDDLEHWGKYLCPAREILSGLNEYVADKAEIQILQSGQQLVLNTAIPDGEYAVYDEADMLAAIAICEESRLKPKLVFNKD